MQIQQFVDEGLGNSTHLVISERTGLAALIDPLRDVDRYLNAAAAAGARISHVLETHIHNDFISGSRELAQRVGARIVASAGADLAFEYHGLSHDETLTLGDIQLRALETPGHTPEHVSYLAHEVGAPEQPGVLFSGGSLLVGAVARTDLLGHEHAVGLGRQLFESLHSRILRLPDETEVYPTHGAGSFCTATPGAARHTTIGRERRFNAFLQLQTPEAFVAELQRVMPSYPRYFHHMRATNRRGPRLLSELDEPRELSPAEVHDRMARGEAVVDTRPVADYLRGHISDSYHVELREVFAVWVGWVVPFGTPVILLADSPEARQEAVRQLHRIGYDQLPGYLAGGMAAWEQAGLPVARRPTLTVEQVRQRLERGEPLLVLDIRQDAEWREGHIPGAQHIEAGALATTGLTLPRDRPIATHCGHEQRSATALSLLERQGYADLHLIDGGWSAWQTAGYPIVAPVGVDQR